MVDIWLEFISALWILIPAYAANGFPPLAKGIHPIDFGKKLRTHRIFGSNKTYEGFIVGLMAGTFYGISISILYPLANAYANQWGISLPLMTPFIGFMISLGALVGDMGGSFIKRRLDMKPGSNIPVLDQANFVIGAVLFSFWLTYISIWMFIIMIVFTLVIHRIACILGYLLRLKKVPW